MNDHYVQSGDKMLRCGYTTGTCAALAAEGAAMLLLGGNAPVSVSVPTPKGWTVEVVPESCSLSDDGSAATCVIRKDAGDDPDITNGMLVVAEVRKTDVQAEPVLIDGGDGVGRVTKPGLDQPVGNAAINHVPRQMIRDAVLGVCEELEYAPARHGSLSVIISIPGGEERAQKTFNPKLGIEGGLSVIGTSGIVEPMSEQALMDTIAVELRQTRALGNEAVILTPGNYGMDYLRGAGLTDRGVPIVKMSNYVGWSLERSAEYEFRNVLLVGHIGKFIKLAGGQMNTHSNMGDRRMELMAEHASRCGADDALQQAVLSAATTEAGLDLLSEPDLLDPVVESLLREIEKQLQPYTASGTAIGIVLFSSTRGELGMTELAKKMINSWEK